MFRESGKGAKRTGRERGKEGRKMLEGGGVGGRLRSQRGLCTVIGSFRLFLFLQSEIHMSEEAIQDILEQTESDPAFQALFDLFDYGR